MGSILASLSAEGTVPVEREQLKIFVRGIATSSTIDCMIEGSISSRPVLWVVFKEWHIETSSAGVAGMTAKELGLGQFRYLSKELLEGGNLSTRDCARPEK